MISLCLPKPSLSLLKIIARPPFQQFKACINGGNYKKVRYSKVTPNMSSSLKGSDNNDQLKTDHSAPIPVSKPTGIKALWHNYGWAAVGTYLSIYIVTLSSVFISLDLDLFNAATFGFDPNEAIKKACDMVEYATGQTFLPNYIRDHPRVGTFAIAWLMTKFTEPLRLAVTVMVTPKVARAMKKVNGGKTDGKTSNPL